MKPDVFDRIEVKVDGDPLPLPTERDLEEIDDEWGVTLPPSYREFVKRFGAGWLGRLLHVFAPGYATVEWDDAYPVAELGTFDNSIHSTADDLDELHHGFEIVPSLLFFADDEGAGYFGWDTTKCVGGEYPVVGLAYENELYPVADSFGDLVRQRTEGPPPHEFFQVGTNTRRMFDRESDP